MLLAFAARLRNAAMHAAAWAKWRCSQHHASNSEAGPLSEMPSVHACPDCMHALSACRCGPCRMIAPIVDELADEYAGKLKCVKLNTDESPNVASEYGIRSIPTIMIFKNGKKCDTVIGAVPKATLQQTVEKYL